MATKQYRQNSMAIMNEHILDLTKLDKEDLNIVLRDKGLIPLSQEERRFLQALHSQLHTTTLLLQNLLPIIQDNPNIPDKDMASIMDEITGTTEDNYGVLAVTIDDIGHGHVIKAEEI